jgi:uncharacterized phage protein (TIGR01671 family)
VLTGLVGVVRLIKQLRRDEMEDRYKFRGWDEENKCWQYGAYYEGRLEDRLICLADAINCHVIIHGGLMYHVDPKTVSQCTGVKDSNDKLVFEKDKVKAHLFYFDGRGEAEKVFEGVVVWNDGDSCWAILIDGILEDGNWHSFAETSHDESGEGIEIIRNVLEPENANHPPKNT